MIPNVCEKFEVDFAQVVCIIKVYKNILVCPRTNAAGWKTV